MIEKERYSRSYIPPEERLCPFCQSKAEDEKHFLLYCVLYDTFRESLFKKLNENIKEAIEQQSTETKFRLLIDPPAKWLQRFPNIFTAALRKEKRHSLPLNNLLYTYKQNVSSLLKNNNSYLLVKRQCIFLITRHQ